ncbi:hypothetical protein MKZ38_010576 [Zalerion maritima]|uniref:Uncharacterized protein n=1 Tax=Zalerion maritima TaxID=339359 RepID=A0AAD5WU34_9PEZI|nr:hypothetical protein MKZ38_010576 [Zalerion maritima]
MEMFEVPGAKRVRRDELPDSSKYERTTAGHALATDEEYARLQAELGKQLSLDIVLDDAPTQSQAQEACGAPDNEPPNDAEEEFEFRLFSHANPDKKVLLRGDHEIIDPTAGALSIKRPRSYYIADPPDQEQRKKFQHSALSGEDILRLSQSQKWGVQLPWRVKHISVDGIDKLATAPATASNKGENTGAKKRLGKKSRIALRKGRKAGEEKKQLAEKQKLEKEEHLKEKKKRLNRIKKLRKRAKKKAGAGEGDEPGEEDDGSSDE